MGKKFGKKRTKRCGAEFDGHTCVMGVDVQGAASHLCGCGYSWLDEPDDPVELEITAKCGAIYVGGEGLDEFRYVCELPAHFPITPHKCGPKTWYGDGMELSDEERAVKDAQFANPPVDLVARNEPLKTGREWAAADNLEITDPRGWEHQEVGRPVVTLDTPITKREYTWRVSLSGVESAAEPPVGPVMQELLDKLRRTGGSAFTMLPNPPKSAAEKFFEALLDGRVSMRQTQIEGSTFADFWITVDGVTEPTPTPEPTPTVANLIEGILDDVTEEARSIYRYRDDSDPYAVIEVVVELLKQAIK